MGVGDSRSTDTVVQVRASAVCSGDGLDFEPITTSADGERSVVRQSARASEAATDVVLQSVVVSRAEIH